MSKRRALGVEACALRGRGFQSVFHLVPQAMDLVTHACRLVFDGARPGIENFQPVIIAQAPVPDDVGGIAVKAGRILFGVVKELLTLHRTSPRLRCSGDNAGSSVKFPPPSAAPIFWR